MKLRVYITRNLYLILGLTSALIVLGVATWYGTHQAGLRAAQNVQGHLNGQLDHFQKYLKSELERVDLVSDILAQNPDLSEHLINLQSEELMRKANQLLKNSNDKLRTSNIFLMDENGLTTAASNFDQAKSFIGKNYAFRPYFKDAVVSSRGQFLAIGVTSQQLGYYVSRAVYYNEKLIGVLVIKMDLAPLKQFTEKLDGHFLLADEKGVIFLSSHKPFELKSIRTISAQDRIFISRTRQYPITKIKQLDVKTSHMSFGGHQAYVINNKKYLRDITRIEELDWTLWFLGNTKGMSNQTLSNGIGIAALGLIALLVFYLFLKRREDAKRFQTIMDNLPSGVTMFDDDLNMVFCNQKFKEVLDFPDSLFTYGLPSLPALFRFNAERGEYGKGDPDVLVKKGI